ncbi:MAG TPA: pyridine nucleotide-disulfide oxidoreductase [Legionella sp.]|nr:pyridine nucleotide-disulfide oxidoreductase [Legionella sp.]
MNKKPFQWAVVGAGPAGIAAVGKLLDHGITPKDILWLDLAFQVGDLGRLWKNVSSNTTVRLFKDFLNAVQSFGYAKAPIDFALNHLPPHETCTLKAMVEPLQWVTSQLKNAVTAEVCLIRHLHLSERQWTLQSDTHAFHAQHVILATGSVPTALNDPNINTIPLEQAIDKQLLSEAINPQDTIAVFGSSHSAIIILQHLVDLGVKKIINFYRSPCRYAIDLGGSVLFDNTGLKGNAALWAREHIDGTWPPNLVRYSSCEFNRLRHLPDCDKAIYATGFTRRNTITIGEDEHHEYNPYVGIIGPGLFGAGIAYPERRTDTNGIIESQVGLWKFMNYLHRVMPIWFKYTT